MPKKLYVRHTTPADESAVFDFYVSNPRSGVAVRKPEVWKEKIAAGSVTIIHDEQDKIVAAAFAYPLVRKTDEGDVHKWTELGSVVVAMDNMGLFKHLMSAHIMRAWLLEPPEERFLCDIVVTNEHSNHVFKKIGATPHQATQEQTNMVLSTMLKSAGVFHWMQMGVETMPRFARNVLEAADSKSPIVHRDTGEEYELDYSRCVLISMFRGAVEHVAASDYGNAQTPDYGRELKTYRAQFKP